ncbi:hypothetical protein BASA81_006354 [Batrachochytrium salamandrivorans]|nr:hypothetical protein BASA81_006354 [Batrachochytrium salamandrivorans]
MSDAAPATSSAKLPATHCGLSEGPHAVRVERVRGRKRGGLRGQRRRHELEQKEDEQKEDKHGVWAVGVGRSSTVVKNTAEIGEHGAMREGDCLHNCGPSVGAVLVLQVELAGAIRGKAVSAAPARKRPSALVVLELLEAGEASAAVAARPPHVEVVQVGMLDQRRVGRKRVGAPHAVVLVVLRCLLLPAVHAQRIWLWASRHRRFCVRIPNPAKGCEQQTARELRRLPADFVLGRMALGNLKALTDWG